MKKCEKINGINLIGDLLIPNYISFLEVETVFTVSGEDQFQFSSKERSS